MERTQRAAVVPADIGWSDVGNWDAVWKLSERDARGNSIYGEGVTIDPTTSHVRSTGLITAAVGVKDVIVVSTQDAVLVLGRDRGDDVKGSSNLRTSNRREATEHKRMYRPWGYYQSIDNGARYQVKRIVVSPGQRLSLQKHYHRAEHWIVVKGTAEVTRGERDDDRSRERVDFPADRRRPPPRQSRQDQPRADRGADRILPRRGRHRSHRRCL